MDKHYAVQMLQTQPLNRVATVIFCAIINEDDIIKDTDLTEKGNLGVNAVGVRTLC